MPTIHETSGVDFEKPFSALVSVSEPSSRALSVLAWRPGLLVPEEVAQPETRARSPDYAPKPFAHILVDGAVHAVYRNSGMFRQDDPTIAYLPGVWEGEVAGAKVVFGPIREADIPVKFLASLDNGKDGEPRYYPHQKDSPDEHS
jgi:hypothetical protein